MRAPAEMWVWGVRYDKGDVIPPDQARTARVLVQLAERFNDGKFPNPHNLGRTTTLLDSSRGVPHTGEQQPIEGATT